MRRATTLALAGILVVAFGAYSAYWWVAAGKIKQGAADWAQTLRDRHIDVSWQSLGVGGYPFSFRLDLTGAVIADTAASPPAQLRAPVLSASIWPWDFHDFWLSAPGGINIAAGPDAAPLAKLDAGSADAAVTIGGGGGATIWLTLYQAKLAAAVPVSVRVATGWVSLPPRAPATHTDPAIGVAAILHDLDVPAAPPGFGKTVDELGFGVTLMGALPAGPLKEALAAWRASGGTVELDHVDLRWGAIGLTGSGTLALDADLQPEGSLSGAISGYDQLLNVLVASGRMKGSDARVAKLALSMLGKPGPDGRQQITTSFAIQNGEMQLGPAKLGKAPHIDW